MHSEVQFTHICPQFVVEDVTSSIDFYKNVLGFDVEYKNGPPVEYAVVYNGEVYIHICLQKTQEFKMGSSCCYICVSNVEKLWEKVKSEKIEIIQPLKENDYGNNVFFRDFTIKDIDGNVLRIGQQINKIS